MKKLLLILTAFLLSISAYAETTVLYNVERLGEGIVLQVSKTQLVFILFSHWDDADTLPTVSPQPPPCIELKDKGTFWMLGIATNFNEQYATGELYYDVAKPDFPLATQMPYRADRYEVSDQHVVGSFLMEKDGDDWWLIMDSNCTLRNKTAFNSIFQFSTPLRDYEDE